MSETQVNSEYSYRSFVILINRQVDGVTLSWRPVPKGKDEYPAKVRFFPTSYTDRQILNVAQQYIDEAWRNWERVQRVFKRGCGR